MVVTFLCFLLSGIPSHGEPGFLCMFWNVENFFEAKPHFNDKCNGIAKTVMLVADEFGRMPDVVGLAEVENCRVVRKLISRTALRKMDYGIIHYDSPDRRGIDCALLYRRSRFHPIFSKPCHLTDPSGRLLPTRDILLVVLEPLNAAGKSSPWRDSAHYVRSGPSHRIPRGLRPLVSGGPLPLPLSGGGQALQGLTPGRRCIPERVAVLVNHHPSKVGKGSDGRRELAMARLLALRDSLMAEGISRIVAVGDFNEEVAPAQGVVPAYPKGAGTIKFQGKWEKIDGCPVLEGLAAREHIFAPPHLYTRDTRFSGTKPLRTFSGPRYLGGLSDHYPIILECLEVN